MKASGFFFGEVSLYNIIPYIPGLSHFVLVFYMFYLPAGGNNINVVFGNFISSNKLRLSWAKLSSN